MQVVFTNKIAEIDFDKLMDVYEESNRENMSNASDFIGNLGDFSSEEIYKTYRNSFISYLKDEFLANKENYLVILKDKDVYLSALRLHHRKDYYLIEALETNPDFRNKGYGERLLRDLLKEFKDKTVFRSEVAISNEKSLALHKKVGFKIVDKIGNTLLLAIESN